MNKKVIATIADNRFERISRQFDSFGTSDNSLNPKLSDAFLFYQKALKSLRVAMNTSYEAEKQFYLQVARNITAQMPLYMQSDSPFAFDARLFFSTDPYARGRIRNDSFFRFASSSDRAYPITGLANKDIIVNRRFTDSFVNTIHVVVTETNDLQAMRREIEAEIKRLEQENETRRIPFNILIEVSMPDDILPDRRKQLQVQLLKITYQQDLTTLRFIHFEERNGLLIFHELLTRGSKGFKSLDKDFFSHNGAAIDLYQLAHWWTNQAEGGPPTKLEYKSFQSAANFFTRGTGEQNHTIEVRALRDEVKQSIPASALSELTAQDFLATVFLREFAYILDLSLSAFEQLPEASKMLAFETLKRIRDIAEPFFVTDKGASDINTLRQLYLILNDELIMYLSQIPTSKGLLDFLKEDSMVRDGDLGYHVTNTLATSGMAGISGILTALRMDDPSIRLGLSDDVYYELPELFTNIFGRNPALVTMNHLDTSVDAATDVSPKLLNDGLFFDLHPNNPKAAVLRNFSVDDLLIYIKKSSEELIQRDKPYTLIIDTSTHNFADQEIEKILKDDEIKALVEQGKLRIVIVQSLVKFSSLGNDKYNGAIIKLYASERDSLHDSISKLNQNDYYPFEGSIADKYLSVLFSSGIDLHLEFVERARQNTRQLLDALEQRGLAGGEKSLVRGNQDEAPIFVAIDLINYLEPFAHVGLKKEELQVMHNFVMDYLMDDAKNNKHLLRRRSGFGFVESSISGCEATMRLMIGMAERPEGIKFYTDQLVRLQNIMEGLSTALSKGQSLESLFNQATVSLLKEELSANPGDKLEDILASNDKAFMNIISICKKIQDKLDPNEILQLKVIGLYYELRHRKR